jgi:hypothetical protein
VAPDSRIVYVDNDPLVLLHARALVLSTPASASSRSARKRQELHDAGLSGIELAPRIVRRRWTPR